MAIVNLFLCVLSLSPSLSLSLSLSLSFSLHIIVLKSLYFLAFLTDRTQQVLVEGSTSDSIEVISCVSQGSVIGPLLFLIFTNGLPDYVQASTRLSGDDCILKNKEDCQILQDDLNRLAEWDRKWGMAFHLDKCSTLRISRSQKPIIANYTLKVMF